MGYLRYLWGDILCSFGLHDWYPSARNAKHDFCRRCMVYRKVV